MADGTPGGRQPLPTAIRDGRIIAIGRGLAPASVPAIADALREGGVRAFELTLDEPADDTLRAIEALAARLGPDDLLVGAGTVLSVEAARRAVDAGARFLVSPHTDLAIVAWAVDYGIAVIPGAATPTEIVAAWNAGATAVKLFPTSTLGAAFVREVRGPLPDVPLVATGGVTVDSAGPLLAAGATAVGLGGWLMGDGVPEVVAARARQIVEVVEAAD